MSWNYAELSRMAKQAGGPELFIETLEKFNFQEGMKAGIESRNPIIALSLGGGFLIGCGCAWLFQWFNYKQKHSEITQEDAGKAKTQLLERMKTAEDLERWDEDIEQ